jgi:hypothetical protein
LAVKPMPKVIYIFALSPPFASCDRRARILPQTLPFAVSSFQRRCPVRCSECSCCGSCCHRDLQSEDLQRSVSTKREKKGDFRFF